MTIFFPLASGFLLDVAGIALYLAKTLVHIRGGDHLLLHESELLSLTMQLSLAWWQRPFTGTVCWNSRLRTSAGRFSRQTQTIELNPRHSTHFGQAALEETIKHELIHYHFQGAGHGPIFRQEATRVGCARFCQPIPHPVRMHTYQCQGCGATFQRKRRFNTCRFRCARCQGIIRLVETRIELISSSDMIVGQDRGQRKGRK